MKIKELILKKNVNEMEMQYAYKLLKTDFMDKFAYGIEIERTDIKNKEIINSEVESINIISPKIEKVDEMLSKLYKNEVSPIHLIDIIGMEVDKAVFDFN